MIFNSNLGEVDISQPNGAGGHYQIMINRFYHGTMHKRDGKWVAFLNAKSQLTPDQIERFGKMLDYVPGEYLLNITTGMKIESDYIN